MKRFGYTYFMVVTVSWGLHAQQGPPTNLKENAAAIQPTNDKKPAKAMQVQEEGVPPTTTNGAPQAVDLTPGWQQDQKPGNYQKKAQAFKKAGEIYDQIHKVEPALQKARNSFFSKKSDINKSIAKFFFDVGVSQNELSDQIDDVLQGLDEEEKEDGELTEEEREIVLELNQNKTDLNQLKKNITAIDELSASLDNALAQIDGQVSRLQKYEDQGWQIYQKIDEIFDDQQANQLVEQMNVLLANAQAIQGYIQGAFAQFFASTSNSITSHIGKIKTAIQALQDRGVQLAQQADQIDQEEEEARIAAEKAAKEAEEAAKKAAEARSWAGRVKRWFTDAWQWVKEGVQTIYLKVAPAPAPTDQPAPQEEPTAAPETTPAPAAQEPGVPTSKPAAPRVKPALPPIQLPPVPQPKPLPQPPG